MARGSGTEGQQIAQLFDRGLESVDRMDIESGTGESIIIERVSGAAAETWTIRRGSAAPWPVESGRARAFLRVLSEVSGPEIPDQSGSQTDSEIRLTLRDATGDTIGAARFGANRIAGLGDAWVDGPDGVRGLRVPDVVNRALAGDAPMAWRDRRTFPGLASDLSRLTIRTPDGEIELARVEGRWGMRSPVVGRADAGVIEGVIRTLQTMECDRFVGGDASAFPDSPRIALTADTDRRGPDGRTRVVESRTLELGGVAPGGGVYLARLGGTRAASGSQGADPLYGPQIVELRADRLSGVPGTVDAYLSRTVVAEPASDIGQLSMSSLADTADTGKPTTGAITTYRRTASGSGWGVLGKDGELTPVTVEDQARLDELAATLAGTRAERVAVLPSEDALPGGIAVTLGAISGAELERCSLFVDTKEGRSTLVARTGHVTRAWTIRPELAAWLASR